jgi:hypothetical protein
MKIKRGYVIAGIVLLLVVAGWFIFRFVLTSEDSWIKDERGVYVKHGNPVETPGYVIWQQAAILCASDLFGNFTEEKDSQCLGVCGNYVVDIVHVPRSAEDDLAENQCEDYMNGFVKYFIELDKDGEIVKIGQD